MSSGPGFHNRKKHICSRICSLLIALTKEPSKYGEITPKIEYWIEYVLREDFLTVDELVEGVSHVAWNTDDGSFASVGKFLKEFRDAPHRSEQARTFVIQMCSHVLRWFAIASTENLSSDLDATSVSSGTGRGFIRAASFVGYLIEWGLLSRELVQRHLTKSLTNHYDNDLRANSPGAYRAVAIHRLFIAAGNTLLRGFLEPDDVQACFDTLETWSPRGVGCDIAAKLKVHHTSHNGASR